MIVGIDEVGMGAFAGPVVIAAVLTPEGETLPDVWHQLRDSKALSAARREAITAELSHNGVQYWVAWVWPQEIDEVGIVVSYRKALQRLIEYSHSGGIVCETIIDGNRTYGEDIIALPKGDTIVPEIMAASIIAKTYRDLYMGNIANEFTEYGFNRNKGYGTAEHFEALARCGPCDIHRKSVRPVQLFAQTFADSGNGGSATPA